MWKMCSKTLLAKNSEEITDKNWLKKCLKKAEKSGKLSESLSLDTQIRAKEEQLGGAGNA